MNYSEKHYQGILRGHIDCEWSIKTDAGGLVHPDGCADRLFDELGTIYLSGVGEKSRLFKPRYGLSVRGLRLKPGSIPFFFGVPASEFLNQTVSVTDFSSPMARAMGAISKCADDRENLVAAAVGLLKQVCFSKTPELRVIAALSQIDFSPLRSVSLSLGITERQIRRLFLREVGISPSRFKRIRRLQRAIDAMRRLPADYSMASFALDHGFFDQAHMNRDLKD
jgi:AraC-like DNA-binding protein